ncbi:hypothetical protein [Moraxella oculi]|nr:hypothetical protein [Moraxella sp. Tifton1]
MIMLEAELLSDQKEIAGTSGCSLTLGAIIDIGKGVRHWTR